MTGGAAAAPTRRRLGREQRRAAIIEGAATAFARGGFAGTSMADISAATGVSHLIVYRHFDSKEALYEAVLEHALDLLAQTLASDAAVGTHGPTPAALLDAARADRAAFSVLWRHASHEPDFARFTGRARDVLRDATEGALGPHVAAGDLTWASRATVAYLVEAVLVWVEDGDPRLDARFIAATSAALKAGVKSWAKSA